MSYDSYLIRGVRKSTGSGPMLATLSVDHQLPALTQISWAPGWWLVLISEEIILWQRELAATKRLVNTKLQVFALI